MALIGYARVSKTDQNFDLQVDALIKADCEKVFTEKQSGTTVKGRDELANCLSYMHDGDTLGITRIDRLARSLRDLQSSRLISAESDN